MVGPNPVSNCKVLLIFRYLTTSMRSEDECEASRQLYQIARGSIDL
jgi:hypothetical protein